jgi:hypothetical protein
MDKLRAFLVLRLLAGLPILDDTLVRVCHLLMGRGLIAATGAVEKARGLSAGDERDELLRKAQQDEIALRLIEWVTSPGQLPRPEDLVPIRTHRLRRK